MKAICYHDKGHRRTGIIHVGNGVAVVVECNTCKEHYHGFDAMNEDDAVKEMKADPLEIDITGFEISTN